jgi:ribonuclease P protein component
MASALVAQLLAVAAFWQIVVLKAVRAFQLNIMPKGVERLKKRAEFLRVAGVRRKWATPGMVLQAARDPSCVDAGRLRVGFTATKKIGNAVVRNRTKRRLRAAADELLPLHAKAGWDYVLIGRKDTAVRDFCSLKRDLLYALKKVGALREETSDA